MKSYLQYAQYPPKSMQQLDNASSGLEGWAGLLSSLSSLLWPLIILIVFSYLFFSGDAPRRLRRLLKPFKSLKIFGAEFVLSEELSEEIKKDAEGAFELYRKQANREYDRLVEIYDLRQKLEDVLHSEVTQVLGRNIRDIQGFRCTIHVPDILFKETLYQLLDYYPRGGGRGRVWSIRFGIIGRTWRLKIPQSEGSIPTEAQKLIVEWGMTKEEAEASGQGRQSFTCVVLRDEEKTPVGIFYMDSTIKDAFGADNKETRDKLEKAIENGCKKNGLTKGLTDIKKELKSRSPLISIYG